MALTDGCVWYVTFDDIINGSYVADLISGRVGSLTGVIKPEYVDGKVYGCLNFPGSQLGGYSIRYTMSDPMPSGLSINGDMSVSIWLNPHQTTHVDSNHSFAFESYSFWCKHSLTNGSISINFNSQSGPNPSSYSDRGISTPCPFDEWSHIVITKHSYDSPEFGSAFVYRNGVQRYGRGFCGSISSRSDMIDIGAHAGYSGVLQNLAYSGCVDEVGIWNRILNDDEILQLYNEGKGLTYPFEKYSTRIGGLILESNHLGKL